MVYKYTGFHVTRDSDVINFAHCIIKTRLKITGTNAERDI